MRQDGNFELANRDDLVTETELAAHWHKSLRTLQRWRHLRVGPAYHKIGGSIFYRRSDIAAYEASCRKTGR